MHHGTGDAWYRGRTHRSGAQESLRTSTCCGRRFGKEVLSSCETCWCTKAALLGKAAGPKLATSHRGALMTSVLMMWNRWCRMRVCILKPGLWKVSAGTQASTTLSQPAPFTRGTHAHTALLQHGLHAFV